MLLYILLLVALFFGGLDSQTSRVSFADFLEKYVNKSGFVDYPAVKKDSGIQSLLKYIAQIDANVLSENERLAFYINSYNILVIKNICDHWPVNSPMDVPGFFTDFRFQVAGEQLSLDEIAYNKIFPLEDVLVHFGLICAAVSCPQLNNYPFIARTLQDQLYNNARRFMQDVNKNRLDKSTNVLYLSEIFKWFRPNFEKRFDSLLKAAQNFLSPEDSAFIANHNISVSFIAYDWTLNYQNK